MTGRQFRHALLAILHSMRSCRLTALDCKAMGRDDGVRAMLADYVAGIHDACTLIEQHCGAPDLDAKGLSGPPEKRRRTKLWPRPEASPTETLREMRLIAEAAVEAEAALNAIAPEGEIQGLDSARMRARHTAARQIVLGKLAIEAKDPAFWTPTLEEDFRAYLEFFPRSE